MDEKTTVKELKDLLSKFMEERDWRQFHHPKNLTMDIAVEAAELMETFVWEEAKHPEDVMKSKKSMDKIREELADVFIASLELANIVGLDVSDIVKNKIELTAKKYPADLVRGKNLKYHEYKKLERVQPNNK